MPVRGEVTKGLVQKGEGGEPERRFKVVAKVPQSRSVC